MIRTLFWLVKELLFFSRNLERYGLCEEGRWIFDAGRFLPNITRVEEAVRPKNRRRWYAISSSPSLQDG